MIASHCSARGVTAGIVDDPRRGGEAFAPASLAAQATREEPSMECDLVVIGSGRGGYPAAIRAAQLGASVVVVEEAVQVGGESALGGGTRLTLRCIPTQAVGQPAH